MKIHLKQNVFDAALDRMRWVFKEFPSVCVNTSGGKDSTVILHLALKVARELNRLPLPVLFIDQEAEWGSVISHVREVMSLPGVKPLWFQGPFRLFNATTTEADPWLHCWREGDAWMRPKETCSIHANPTKCDRFKQLFIDLPAALFRDSALPVANIAGVRCEESPSRTLGLTNQSTYKGVTWGSKAGASKGVYTFYPIYDWGWRDVWKAIHDNSWPYCKLYDWQYQHGLPINSMRVSNVHHETSIESLRYLQELEPEVWDKVVARVKGVNAVARLREAYSLPPALPPMFSSWREYRDHLLDNLILVDEARATMRKRFDAYDGLYMIHLPECEQSLMKAEISSILVNDIELTKLENWSSGKSQRRWSSTRNPLSRSQRPKKPS